MHPFSILTLGIFIAGYITARWDLVTRLYELAIFAADHGVVVRPDQTLPLLLFQLIYRTDQSSQGLCPPHRRLLPLHRPGTIFGDEGD